NRLADSLPAGTHVGFLSAGEKPIVHLSPTPNGELPASNGRQPAEASGGRQPAEASGGRTDLASAVSLATGLFPPGASRRIVLMGDGAETQGDLEAAARDAALLDVTIDAVPIAGEQRPDVRVLRLASDKSRSYEGATLELTADIESSMTGKGTLRLFENGIETEARHIELSVGQKLTEIFNRTPERGNVYTYRVRLDGFSGDALPDNNQAMAMVDVRGRPSLLYIEGEPNEAHYLVAAMEDEGLRIDVRPPEAFPRSMQELAGYDGVIVSDVPAHKFTEESMTLVQDYVEKLGGGFVMIGGKNSFGVGGYYRTPIEEVLPVKMKAPDREERYSVALCLVIDRSGSMQGQKIEIAKSAAVATVDLLTPKDYVGVVAFDSNANWLVPMTRVTSKAAINSQISALNSGGGTNAMPGMTAGRQALQQVQAKVKHMIVLTDGQTRGTGYEALAAQLKGEGVTVSTVAIGQGAHGTLLQA
ncbi:MAG: VWA domain-containing protein, partial [Planctomycetaceae bacterium]